MARVQVVNFGKYRGMKIHGSTVMSPPIAENHLDEASWLTAMVESNGRFGCVMNYDGTGMTAGIHQAIAVYPSALADNNRVNDQGPLWKLLDEFRTLGLTAAIDRHLKEYGVYLSLDGKCVSEDTGKPVTGQFIRNMFTGDAEGIMPLDGKGRRECRRWVVEFHEAFSEPYGLDAQLNYGKRHFETMSRRRLRFCRNDAYAKMTLSEVFYDGVSLTAVCGLPDHYSLAMSLFWSHSVNAPGYALKVLCRKVVDKLGVEAIKEQSPMVSKAIVAAFGNSSFGRWSDDLENGRYQRTRNYAKKYWDAGLFDVECIMPYKVSRRTA
jgi:hypothetical protein